MAHRILVWIDVDDDYVDIDPQITAEDYLEGSKAYGWEVVTDRLFTESEVRAAILDVIGSGMTIEEKRNVLRERHGIVLDPAQRPARLPYGPSPTLIETTNMESKQDISKEQDRADGNRAVMASAPLQHSGSGGEWLDEDDDDRAPDYYICMCCGHSEVHGGIGLECSKCCGPMDAGYF